MGSSSDDDRGQQQQQGRRQRQQRPRRLESHTTAEGGEDAGVDMEDAGEEEGVGGEDALRHQQQQQGPRGKGQRGRWLSESDEPLKPQEIEVMLGCEQCDFCKVGVLSVLMRLGS